MKKTGRNDPCPCGSGKKFKKCCESTMIGGRFMATKVDAASIPSRMTGLFQSRVFPINSSIAGGSKPIRVTTKPAEDSSQPITSETPSSEEPGEEKVEKKDEI